MRQDLSDSAQQVIDGPVTLSVCFTVIISSSTSANQFPQGPWRNAVYSWSVVPDSPGCSPRPPATTVVALTVWMIESSTLLMEDGLWSFSSHPLCSTQWWELLSTQTTLNHCKARWDQYVLITQGPWPWPQIIIALWRRNTHTHTHRCCLFYLATIPKGLKYPHREGWGHLRTHTHTHTHAHTAAAQWCKDNWVAGGWQVEEMQSGNTADEQRKWHVD